MCSCRGMAPEALVELTRVARAKLKVTAEGDRLRGRRSLSLSLSLCLSPSVSLSVSPSWRERENLGKVALKPNLACLTVPFWRTPKLCKR